MHLIAWCHAQGSLNCGIMLRAGLIVWCHAQGRFNCVVKCSRQASLCDIMHKAGLIV